MILDQILRRNGFRVRGECNVCKKGCTIRYWVDEKLICIQCFDFYCKLMSKL